MTRVKKDAALQAALKLEQVLTARRPGGEREWCEQVSRSLADAEQALREHLYSVAEPDGLRTRVQEIAQEIKPALDRSVNSLQRQLIDLRARAAALQDKFQEALQAVALPPTGRSVPDFGALQKEGEELVAAVRQTKEGEIKLIQETVNTDIGAGD